MLLNVQALSAGPPPDVLTPLDELDFWLQLANDRSAGGLRYGGGGFADKAMLWICSDSHFCWWK